jgi:ABC-type sulfate transport system substrate-binding protein
VIKTLATAKEYGGWTDIQKKIFDESAIFDKVLGER